MKRQREGDNETSIEMENAIVAAIFQIGLNQSSPKSLISLMPETPELTREHIKSHLQKYRIQSERTNEQFFEFFEKHMRAEFYQFLSDYEKNQVKSPSTSDENMSWSLAPLENLSSNEPIVDSKPPSSNSSTSSKKSKTQDFEPSRHDLDSSGTIDISASSEEIPSTAILESNEIIKLKAEFEAAYRENLGIKQSLVELTDSSQFK